MGTDSGETDAAQPFEDESDADGRPEPIRRRSTFVAPLTRQAAEPRVDVGGRTDAGRGDHDVHDDDELAVALEKEVSLLTASLPIIRPEGLFTQVPAPEPPFEPRTEAERKISAEADSGDTLAAIEHLEALIARRRHPIDREAPSSPTAAASTGSGTLALGIPIVRQSEPGSDPRMHSDRVAAPEHRVGRSRRVFWLWFAVGSSIVAGLGAVFLVSGLNLP